MNFQISETNKNVVIFFNDKNEYPVVIPPTNGNRIDFIDRSFKYHYDYKGIVSHGYLIEIVNGYSTITHINHYTTNRLHRMINKISVKSENRLLTSDMYD